MNFYSSINFISINFRLLSVEYFKNILDITINSFALSYNSRVQLYLQKIISLNPFEKLISYFFEFEFNNVYQKLFEDIVVLLINKHTPEELIKSFFVDNDFIGKFIDHSINNYLFKFR